MFVNVTAKSLVISLIIVVLSLTLGFGLGALFFRGCSHSTPDKTTDSIKVPDTLIQEDQRKIDSLKEVIKEREESIGHLKDSVKIIETIRTIEVDNIKKLPLDSAVMYLNLKLGEYYDRYN